MAISLAQARQIGQKRTTSKKLAKEYEAQQSRAQKRKGWSSLLGGVGGKLLGTALAGMTGGLAAPLLMAAGTFAGKKAAHELTRGMGADVGAISEGDAYGYGKEESKTLKGMLESQMAVDPLKERGGFGKDLLSAYASATLSGGLTGSAKALFSGDKGSMKHALIGKEGWKGLAGSKEALLGLLPEGEDYIEKGKDVTSSAWETLEGGDQYNPVTGEHLDVEDWSYQQGGRVPQMNPQQLMQLLSLAQMQQQETTYNGTSLEQKQPTISEYFESQGKTLGGNNTQSLSQILGK